MAEHFKSPLTIYVLWHPEFADGRRLADRLFTALSRNVKDPFKRTIGIPVYYRSEPANRGSGEVPAPISLQESDRNAIVVLVDTHMLLSKDWKEYVHDLMAAMRKDENRTRVFPVANDFDSFGFEELGASNYIRMFEADKRTEWGAGPSADSAAADPGGELAADVAAQKRNLQDREASLRAREAALKTRESQLRAREAALADRGSTSADSGLAVSVGQPAVQGNGVNINITIHHPNSAGGAPEALVAETAEGSSEADAAHRAAPFAANAVAAAAASAPAPAVDHDAYEKMEAEMILQQRENFLLSKLVHQLCRLLESMPMVTDEGTTVSAKPVNLFLSHAKADGAEIAKQIKRHIEDDSSMKTFFDANDIAAGYEFSDEIKGAIERSALICIQTDYYATREWCLYEVIIAKRLNRPLVVLNAVQEREPRSFPYIGNVPTMRWNPDAPSALREVVDMAMLEVLYRSYTALFQRALRKLYKLSGLHTMGHPPELFIILKLREDAQQAQQQDSEADSQEAIKYILYPDPPLGAEEVKLLEDLSPDLRFITPTMLPVIQQMQAK